MKKLTILLFIIFSINIFSEMPKEYLREVKSEGARLYSNINERKDYINWQIDSYDSMEKKLQESGIEKHNQRIVLDRLFKMYKYNFIKQNGVIESEIEKFLIIENKDKVTKKIEKEAKVKIEKLKIKDNLKENIIDKAKMKYPTSYEKQKIYIEGFLDGIKEKTTK